MDPLSQGVVGAVLAQSFAKKEQVRWAGVSGFLAGLIADLDILIRSETDALMQIEYHRHFTHSLIFIPVGGLIAAVLLFPFLRKKLAFASLYRYTTLGYATSGLLDACTSYGTRLLWPFSDARIAWDNIAIIDPLFTLPLLFLVCWAAWRIARKYAVYALCFALLYLSLGVIQRERVAATIEQVALARGHQPMRLTVKPSIFNVWLWRTIYEYDNRYYADAVHQSWGEPVVYEGGSAVAYHFEEEMPALDPSSRLWYDLKRFDHFSDGYVVAVVGENDVVGDFRYATLPNGTQPMWAVDFSKSQASEGVQFRYFRELNDKVWQEFGAMLRGEPLP